MKDLVPNWLTELIANQGESKPMDVSERESLLEALKAAYSPESIDPERHRHILDQVLGDEDPLAPPSEQEVAEAAMLRDHLDSDPLVVTLRAAQGTWAATSEVEQKLRVQALRPNSRANRTQRGSRSRSLWAAFAVAAGVAIWFSMKSNGTVETFESSQSSLAVSRSTESLFSKSFETTSASERIDKIAQVRARDLRNNRYAQWGLP